MPGKPRRKVQRRRDNKRIGELYLRGWSQAEIAEELSLSVPTISRDIATLHDDWIKSSLVDYDEAKAKELAKIDRLEYEYWDAWLRSCEDKETETVKGIAVGASKDALTPLRKEQTKREEGQTGDPRFLTGIQWCINKRCEILGLDAPNRTDFTSGGKSLADIQEWKKIEEDNIREVALLEG